MQYIIPRFYFDKKDYILLDTINNAFEPDQQKRYHSNYQKLLTTALIPNGIKELATTPTFHLAYAAINLFGSLQEGKITERLHALQILRDEVLAMPQTSLRINTGRVLLQILKEILRAKGNIQKQLCLVRDFRGAAKGNPRVIHAQLKKYHLIPMPEDWNQVSFDDRVYDANTKGRKSATHLIMDAWIKGIRSITVVYYNYVNPQVVRELLEAGELMGIKPRIGFELPVLYRNKFIKIIWLPRGFTSTQEYLQFLASPPMQDFQQKTKAISSYYQQYIFTLLETFKDTHAKQIEEMLQIELPNISKDDFLNYVGAGQASLHHFANYLHQMILPILKQEALEIQKKCPMGTGNEKELTEYIAKINMFTVEYLLENFLLPNSNTHIADPNNIPKDTTTLPLLMQLEPFSATKFLKKLRSTCYIALITHDMPLEDAVEILYTCRGNISHIHIFDLKYYNKLAWQESALINQFCSYLNQKNSYFLKKTLLYIISNLSLKNLGEPSQCKDTMKEILQNINKFKSFYKINPLHSRIGSGSTGGSASAYGMGFVVKETLSRKAIKFTKGTISIPATVELERSIRFIPKENISIFAKKTASFLAKFPPFSSFSFKKINSWKIKKFTLNTGGTGNIIPLGGSAKRDVQNFTLNKKIVSKKNKKYLPLKYLNTSTKNWLKIFAGFLPAFLTFYLTKEWWILSYFGAVIWFSITGIRNIMQSILGSGGLRRSPLLRWHALVNWDRIADSLFYTGLSVPLLEGFTKIVLLQNTFDITTSTNPILFFSIMAIINGTYITSHNLFRGFSKTVAFGNFFRSVLSVPVALLFNEIFAFFLVLAGSVQVDIILQRFAAIISKLASDLWAGVLEGFADRINNLYLRKRDVGKKLQQIQDIFSDLEVLYPERDMLDFMNKPTEFLQEMHEVNSDLEHVVIINALDMLYIWMYQPRGNTIIKQYIAHMNIEDKVIFLVSQRILQEETVIAQFIINGLVGNNFSRVLPFYLTNYQQYLKNIENLIAKYAVKKFEKNTAENYFSTINKNKNK